MKIRRIITLMLVVLVFTLIACASPTVSPDSPTVSPATPPDTSDQLSEGQQFVRKIRDSLEGIRGWTPPLPPTGGQKPRVLTKEEKDKVLEIANAVPEVVEVKQNKDIVSVDTSYIWVGWRGSADGVGFISYEPIEKGIKDVSDKSDTWYPAADFLFHSIYGEYYAFGIYVAVSLETEKVVWIDVYSSPPIPLKR